MKKTMADETEVTELGEVGETGDVVGEAKLTPLGRGIRIIQAFTTEQYDLSSQELIRRSGLPKPTAFRTIATLRELGLLRYSNRRNKYMLAPLLLTLTAPLLSSMTIRSLARPTMQEFADYAQGQVTLVVGTPNHELIYVEALQGRGNSVFRPEVGTQASLSRSAAGRAYMALLEPDEREEVLRDILAKAPDKEAWLPGKMKQTLEDIATRGYCRNEGELDRVTIGVSVPVRTLLDEQRFVFSCMVPAFRLASSPQVLEDLGMRLATLVHSVEAALGNSRG
jgi:DNA-binding IclR family transcriptional regulator